MSAFLGKIHYWLYNKIQIHEKFIEDIIDLSKSKGYDSETLLNESYSKFGPPVKGELEEKIDHANIHGWLQGRIVSVESRLAYIVTELLKENVVSKEEIGNIFYENGKDTMKNLALEEIALEDIFNLIFDYMIEGMPCDRVNEVTYSSEDVFEWRTLIDIHKEYWDDVKGDVENFYYFRDSWINGFLSENSTQYKYTRTKDGINTIRKV